MSETDQVASSSSADLTITRNLIQQVVHSVTPALLEASKSVAEEISKSTLAEMEAWNALQESRRERDHETFTFPGNKEQYSHESHLMSILENADLHLKNASWEKAKQQIVQGKALVSHRLQLLYIYIQLILEPRAN